MLNKVKCNSLFYILIQLSNSLLISFRKYQVSDFFPLCSQNLLFFTSNLHNLSIKCTFPLNEISPVIAKFCLIGLFKTNDNKAEVIVTPAEGPSLCVAPSGACIWISLLSDL